MVVTHFQTFLFFFVYTYFHMGMTVSKPCILSFTASYSIFYRVVYRFLADFFFCVCWNLCARLNSGLELNMCMLLLESLSSFSLFHSLRSQFYLHSCACTSRTQQKCWCSCWAPNCRISMEEFKNHQPNTKNKLTSNNIIKLECNMRINKHIDRAAPY